VSYYGNIFAGVKANIFIAVVDSDVVLDVVELLLLLLKIGILFSLLCASTEIPYRLLNGWAGQ
jgi:hypothetical protein